MKNKSSGSEELNIPVMGIELHGDLQTRKDASGIVIFAHGSGSGRKSSRNRYVASVLNDAGFDTLLFDLLTEGEEREDISTGRLRFEIKMLASRLTDVARWIAGNRTTRGFPIGLFGASTGAAAAIIASVKLGVMVKALVSRGGRPDLAADYLGQVTAPVLLIVGGNDYEVIKLNREAGARINAPKEMIIIPGATHLFEEPGALEKAASAAGEWFLKYLKTTNKPDI